MNGNKTEEPKTVYIEYESSYIEICPYCREKSLEIREVVHQQPYLRKTLIISKNCKKCGFKKTEMLPLNPRKRRIIAFKMIKKEDLYVKILRTSTATIFLPELGAVIDPGIDAPYFITNVEGLLSRIEDALERIRVLEISQESEYEITKLKKIIKKIKEGKHSLTIIIDDPIGLSDILAPSGKVIREYVEGY
ncbi:MAG: hypothetical protein DRJ38_02260 [Thermoprotei archaeon]|nr:MAG: hypothetical protein DRJ38_02260 [Thermoprotei archaeon]